jgi:hypothetical protein
MWRKQLIKQVTAATAEAPTQASILCIAANQCYELLNEVRLRGDCERWLEFFAEGIGTSAMQAVATANALLALVSANRDRIARLGRAAPSALAVHQALQRQPISTAASLVKATGLTAATVNKPLAHLERISVEWRSCFAEQLRHHGISANATERAARGQSRTHLKTGIYRSAARGESRYLRDHWRRIQREMRRHGPWFPRPTSKRRDEVLIGEYSR